MKKITSFIMMACVAVGLMVSKDEAAAQAVNAKIVVVDFERVTRDAEVSKDVNAQLQKERLAIQGKAAELQSTLGAERQALESQRNIIAADAFQQKAQAWQQKAQAAEGSIQQLNQRLQVSAQQAQLEIAGKLKPIIRTVMEAKGATMVLDKQVVYLSVGGLDITTEVIDLLNKEISNLQIQAVNTEAVTPAVPAKN